MKKLFSSWCGPSLASRGLAVALFGTAVALLGGCPVYSDNAPWQCNVNGDCPNGYYCDGNGTCINEGGEYDAGVATPPSYPVDASITPPVATTCTQPAGCGTGYTCAIGGQCEIGSCDVTGCVSGYVCELDNGIIQCLPDETPSSPTDAGAGTDASVACQSSSDCANISGAQCLDGVCVAPENQCFDESQCYPGYKCVQGACTPSCAAGPNPVSCPTGYSCTVVGDAGSAGVCNGDPTPCEANPSVCASGTVCSQNHCVAPCGAGGTCAAGEQCIQGGCVPTELPSLGCTNDGVQDSCVTGSICLHHNCYLACDADAAGTCQSDGQYNTCKPVTESGSTYYVCGTSTSLGTECDPVSGQQCANSSAICIDGFCY